MGKDRYQDSAPRAVNQGVDGTAPEPIQIKASTPYDFEGRNLTAYGGLLPVATMLEKPGLPETGRGTLDGEEATQGHDHAAVHPGKGAGQLRGFLSPVSFTIPPTGADAHRNLRT